MSCDSLIEQEMSFRHINSRLPKLELATEISSVKGKFLYIFDINNSNFDELVLEFGDLVFDVWSEFASKNNITFLRPQIIFFNGEIELDKNYTGYGFYYKKDNNIYINRYNFIELIRLVGKQVGIITILAHELGHSIQNLNGNIFSKFPSEQLSDYLAGFILKLLRDNGTLSDVDLEIAKLGFYNLGYSCDKNFINHGMPNIHGNGVDRYSSIDDGIKASDDEVILRLK